MASMRSSGNIAFALSALLLWTVSLMAASPLGSLRYSIVVDKLENKSQSQRALGDEWSMLLSSKLHESGHFIVVAQTDMQLQALKEQLRSMSGAVTDGRKTAVRGHMTPAQLLVQGVITDFTEGSADQAGGIKLGGFTFGGGQQKTEIRAILQIVEASTGALVASKEIVGTAAQRKFSVKRDGGEGYEGGRSDNVHAALEKAIDEAIPWMVAQLPSVKWRGSVMRVDKERERVIVNRGTREGVSAGDEFIVGEAEILRDPDTGEVIEELIRERARLKVIEVSDRTAVCSVVSGKISQIVERMAIKYGNES